MSSPVVQVACSLGCSSTHQLLDWYLEGWVTGGGAEHRVHLGTSLLDLLPLRVLQPGWLRPVALVTAMSSTAQLPAHLRWIRPPPPSPTATAVGSPGWGCPHRPFRSRWPRRGEDRGGSARPFFHANTA